jgi:DNA adenine methylase Dam
MLKWTGSKAWLTPFIQPVPVCYEPFGGSANVSLTCSQLAHVNDTCGPLIALYEAFRTSKEETVNEAERLFKSINHSPDPKRAFYEMRSRFNAGEKTPENFLVLIYMGFNGLWRESKNGCNVPYGGLRTFPRDKLLSFPAEKFGRLTCDSWDQVSVPDEECLIFVDPPYAGAFVSYNENGWTQKENEQLFSSLAIRPNPVVITCLHTDSNEQLLTELSFEQFIIPKKYANGVGSVVKGEIIAYNGKGREILKLDEMERLR